MLYRIAESIGGCTVSELENRLSFVEFLEWCTYLKIKGWREEGKDLSGPFLPDHPDYEIYMSMAKMGSA